jgi:hypothetical protein
MAAAPTRIIALGASNLTRGFPLVVAASRSACGPDVEIFAALGLGRSYGMESRVLARTLPGILDCGLWSAIAARPPSPTRALVTDVGNDILYGASPRQILEWVEQALQRLAAHTRDIVVCGLPLHSIRTLSAAKYLAFRTITFPRSRLPFVRVVADAEHVDEGLQHLARAYSARFVPLRAEWYGFDPIHIRYAHWSSAWAEVCGDEGAAGRRPRMAETIRLLALAPERQRLFGIERLRPQRDGALLPGGGRVWLY